MIFYALGYENTRFYHGFSVCPDDKQALDFYDKLFKKNHKEFKKFNDFNTINIYRLGKIDDTTGLIVPERTKIRSLVKGFEKDE